MKTYYIATYYCADILLNTYKPLDAGKPGPT